MQETQNGNGEVVGLRFDDGESGTIVAGMRILRAETEMDGELHPERVNRERLDEALEAFDDYIAKVIDGQREATNTFEVTLVSQSLELLRDMHEGGMLAGARVYRELSPIPDHPAALVLHGMTARRMLEEREVALEES